jgi:hypothetical protein
MPWHPGSPWWSWQSRVIEHEGDEERFQMLAVALTLWHLTPILQHPDFLVLAWYDVLEVPPVDGVLRDVTDAQ